MKVKHRKEDYTAWVEKLNPCGIGEFIAIFKDGSRSSEYCKDYQPLDFEWGDLIK